MGPVPSADDEYRPIDCSLHDRFEAAAVRRAPVHVSWTPVDGDPREIEGLIRDVRAREGVEYLLMDDGTEIRLDRIRAFSELRSGTP